MKSMKWMFLLFLLGFSSTCTISFKRGFERVTGVEVPDQWTVPNAVTPWR